MDDRELAVGFIVKILGCSVSSASCYDCANARRIISLKVGSLEWEVYDGLLYFLYHSNNKNGKLPKIARSAKFAIKSPPHASRLGLLIYWLKGVNRHAAYGLLVKKSNSGEREMGSLRSSGDSIEGKTIMHGLMSYRRFGRARSLRSDRAEWKFGRYLATEAWLKLSRYVATERSTCLVAA
ncbi:hypothetical protein F2Q69_00053019 [Brassica cretica]|uniref:Uncharacterized protein n=1 Tax=Brassica cretica TaxID=69181 RepID=A0A8S9MVG8_BRACR|nr:hypothetical protein F2Q69_00053019 [Brassica cretica]